MYQKILNALQDFFGISRKEARGALVMMLFCAIIIWTPFVFRRWVLPMVPPGSPPPERQVLDSIAALLERQQQRSFKPGKRLVSERIHLAPFDPNTASESELTGLGIPPYMASRIVKFRSKGGQFRRKEDLLKIYDFPPELYARLEKYIVVQHVAAKKASFLQEATFDINQCDTTALIRLKGIGSKLAQRILKFRDGLGGFHSVAQYAEIYGLDSLALNELRRYARIESAVKKLQINAATAEELGRHPYLRNRRQMQILVNYREQHGGFHSLEELRDVKVLDEATIQKIGPYLSF